MANQEHIELLKKSVEEWNQWRKKNPDLIPDLNNTNLKEINCRKANLKKASIQGTHLQGAKLQGADLQEAKLYNAFLNDAKLQRANIYGADLGGADLSEADLDGADLTGAVVTEEQLLKAKYIGARFDLEKFGKIFKEYKDRHDECSKDVRRIGLVLIAYATFCFLTLGKAGEKILVDNEVKLPFADVPIDFQTFMIVGPLALILITGYFHLFIHELHRYQELPHKNRLPFAFNLDNWFARLLSNWVFYFLTPAVLFVFSVKSRVLPFSGDIWRLGSWVVAAYLIYVYWKHNLNLKKTKWEKSGSIIYGLILLGIGSFSAEEFRDDRIILKENAALADRDFRGWNLQGLVATKAKLERADLLGANLQDADLLGANLQDADLQGANLQEANLQEANLQEANLQGADLTGAKLERVNLQGADLQGANLQGANLARGRPNRFGTHRETRNLSCEQVNSIKSLDSNTRFPNYLEVKIIGGNKWNCKEVKKGK